MSGLDVNGSPFHMAPRFLTRSTTAKDLKAKFKAPNVTALYWKFVRSPNFIRWLKDQTRDANKMIRKIHVKSTARGQQTNKTTQSVLAIIEVEVEHLAGHTPERLNNLRTQALIELVRRR